MQISVNSDVDKALKGMSRLHKKQMPFAAALGLSMTAKKVARVEQRMMVRKLDRPTPFTIKGVRWQGASKNDFKTGLMVLACCHCLYEIVRAIGKWPSTLRAQRLLYDFTSGA